MWTRKELKQKAKEALIRNYWKIVLVSALFILVGGGSGSVGSGFSCSSGNAYQNNVSTVADVENGVDVIETESGNFLIGQYETEDTQQIQSSQEDTQTTVAADQEPDHEDYIAMVVLAVAVFAAVFIVLFVIIFAVQVFLCNPLRVGTDRFMLKSIDDKAEVKEIAYGFDHSYLNIVKTLFFSDLYIFLWSLLFIIPGIYKTYQYRMVSYIAAEHPEMNYKEVLQLSKDMMSGEKWHAFVLDLSFIPWHILGVITCGILEIFYIAPYQNLTNAVRYGKEGGKVLVRLREDVLTIADDGQKIEPEFVKHIFEPFSRADKARTTKGGSGLGLSITAKIVQMHGGELKLDCDFGEGYTKAFQVLLKKEAAE